MATKLAKAIKEILVNLAVDDKLPLDMTELDPNLFNDAINKHDEQNNMVGGITQFDITEYIKEEGITLTDTEVDEVLAAYSDNYMCNGEGLHGTELIQYCLEQLGMD